MKKIMIVGAGKAQVPLIEAAKNEGYYTIACDWNPDALGVQLADEFCNVSTRDRAGLYKTAIEKKIDGVVANSEYAMCDVAFISSELGLVGNPENAIAVLSSKNKFRELQNLAGLFAPKVFLDIANQKKIASYPLIIKPDMNSGTRGTTVINDETEDDRLLTALEICSRLSRNKRPIVEEFIHFSPDTVIEGEIFIHNGEILWDGLFSSIRSEEAPMIPMTYIFPLINERIDEILDAINRAFCVAGVLHGEYNIEACFVDNKPFIIEINPRQGGNDLPKYVQKHCGIDYYKLLVTTSIGNDYYWNSLRGFKRQNNRITHHMLYPHKNGKFKGIWIAENIKDRVYHSHLILNDGDMVKASKDGSDSIGYVDLVFENSEEQSAASKRLKDLIKIEYYEN